MITEMWYEWIVWVANIFLGAFLRTRDHGKRKYGFLMTLFAVIVAAGVWYLWQQDGSLEPSRLCYIFSLVAGTLLGEVIVIFMWKKGKWTYTETNDDTD